MTIRTDIDAAIEDEATKRRNGKRAKANAALIMGEPAIRELRRQGASGPYRGYPIIETTEFQGWELRC